jgi:prepilin-type processing-associated H-X9-DG protein
MYFDDIATTFNVAEDGHGLWLGYLIAYQGNVNNVRRCPSTPELSTNDILADAGLPSQYGGGADKSWYYVGLDNSGNYEGGYALNGYFYTTINQSVNAGSHPDANFKHESDVKHPVQTPIFADSVWIDAWPDPGDKKPVNLYLPAWASYNSGTSGSGMMRFCVGRHGGQNPPTGNLPPTMTIPNLPCAVNVAFVDGHVETVKLPKLWQLYWSKDWPN